jgi:hypothetical protein
MRFGIPPLASPNVTNQLRNFGRIYLRCCALALPLSPWVFWSVFEAPACFRTDPLLGEAQWSAANCPYLTGLWAPFYMLFGPPIDVYDEAGPPWYAYGIRPLILTTLITGAVILSSARPFNLIRKNDEL